MPGIKSTLFGKIAVQAGMITDGQLRDALERQIELETASGQSPRIGEILMQLGYLKQQQIDAVLAHLAATGKPKKRKPRFGEIAAAFGMIDATQVKDALKKQRQQRAQGGATPKLGELLIEAGVMMPHQVRAVLTEQEKKIVTCPVCGAGFNIRLYKNGQKIRCGACHAVLVVQDDDEVVLDPASTQAGSTRVQQKIGDFFVELRLGQDAIGKTYRCVDSRNGNTVAIKVFSNAAIEEPTVQEKLLKQIRQAATLKHDNLRRLYSMGRFKGRVYVVMEYFEGQSLRGIMRKVKRVDSSKVLSMTLQVCRALALLHDKGIVHGDIRPSNVLLTAGGVLKLAGLGLSLSVTDNVLTIVEGGEEAPFYFAPEQVADKDSLGTHSDIYSLGACMYHALTGQPPFQGRSPFEVLVRFTEDTLKPIRELNPAVPEPIAKLIERMLAPEPTARFRDAGEVLRELESPPPPGEASAMDFMPEEEEMRPERVSAGAAISIDNLDAGLPVYYRTREQKKKAERTFSGKQLMVVGAIGLAILAAVMIVAFAGGSDPRTRGDGLRNFVGSQAQVAAQPDIDDLRERYKATGGMGRLTVTELENLTNDIASLAGKYTGDQESLNAITTFKQSAAKELDRRRGTAEQVRNQLDRDVGRAVNLGAALTLDLSPRAFSAGIEAYDLWARQHEAAYAGTSAVDNTTRAMRAKIITRAGAYAQLALDTAKQLVKEADEAVTEAEENPPPTGIGPVQKDVRRLTDEALKLLGTIDSADFSHTEIASWRTKANGEIRRITLERQSLLDRLGATTTDAVLAAYRGKVAHERDTFRQALEGQRVRLDAIREKAASDFNFSKASTDLASLRANTRTLTPALTPPDNFYLEGRPLDAGTQESERTRTASIHSHLIDELNALLKDIDVRGEIVDSQARLFDLLRSYTRTPNHPVRTRLAAETFELQAGRRMQIDAFEAGHLVARFGTDTNIRIPYNPAVLAFTDAYPRQRFVGELARAMYVTWLLGKSDPLPFEQAQAALGGAVFAHSIGAHRVGVQFLQQAKINPTVNIELIEASLLEELEREAQNVVANLQTKVDTYRASPLTRTQQRDLWRRLGAEVRDVRDLYGISTYCTAGEGKAALDAIAIAAFMEAVHLPASRLAAAAAFARDPLPSQLRLSNGAALRDGRVVVPQGGQVAMPNSLAGVRLAFRFDTADEDKRKWEFKLALTAEDALHVSLARGPSGFKTSIWIQTRTGRKTYREAVDLSTPVWHELYLLRAANGDLAITVDYVDDSGSAFKLEAGMPALGLSAVEDSVDLWTIQLIKPE